MRVRAAVQSLLSRAVGPRVFAFIRLRWREFLFVRQTVASWFIRRTPEVRGFGESRGAEELLKTIGSVNVLARTKLCWIMLRHGSDKSYHSHNYTTVYSALFKELGDRPLRIFELGLGSNNPAMPFHMGTEGIPGASLRGWRENFPHAQVYGADIDRDSLFEEDRIKTYQCDQLSQRSICELWAQPDLQEGADIVIEDGLHTFEGNVSFLEGSLEHLRPGGLYVIEDIRQDTAAGWWTRLEAVYSSRYPECAFAFVSLPTFADVRDNNLLVVRRNAEQAACPASTMGR